ncbi:MAG: sigma-70 family RNA polymerase sigma factor [Candidatus Pristimantibacillus sp.]
MEGLELVKRARDGSREAFIELIRMHEPIMYSIAQGILRGSKADIIDAIQESILLAYKGIIQLREPAFFRTWLVRILINECRKMLKHNRKVVPVELIYEKKSGEMESDMELMDLLSGLDLEHKEIVILFYIEDIPIKEIAQIVGLTESGVKSRLYRARFKLAMLLKEPDMKEELL